MLEKIIKIIAEYQGIDESTISGESNLMNDIGLSSFDVVSLACKFEEEFEIEIPDRNIRTLKTVNDIVNFVSNL